MNLARGLFRLWLVFAVVWVVAVGAFLRADKAVGAYLGRATVEVPFAEGRIAINVPANETPEAMKLVLMNALKAHPEWIKQPAGPPDAQSPAPGLIALTNGEVGEIYVATFLDDLEKTRSKAVNDGKLILSSFAYFGWLPPLGVLLLGAALVWALRGFHRS